MLIKGFPRHFMLRALIIATIQAGFIVAKLTGLLAWHWLLIFVPLLLISTILAIFLFIITMITILSDKEV